MGVDGSGVFEGVDFDRECKGVGVVVGVVLKEVLVFGKNVI